MARLVRKSFRFTYESQALRGKGVEFLSLTYPVFKVEDEEANGPRVLIVCDEAAPSDVDSGELLAGPESDVLLNLVKRIRKQHGVTPSTLYVLNWTNAASTLRGHYRHDLHDPEIVTYYNERVETFIERQKIETVVFAGMDSFSHYMNRDNSSSRLRWTKKFNRLFTLTTPNGHKYKVVGTANLVKASSQDPSKLKAFPNMLGSIMEGMTYAFKREFPYRIKIPDFVVHYIDTIAKFDKFFSKLERASIVSIDTETRNLARVTNMLYTVQFALGTDAAYFIPLNHPDTPFKPKEIKYILDTLKTYFERGKSEYHIYHHAKFDLIQFISAMDLRYYAHKVYDTIAGEFALDENRKLLGNSGLAQVESQGKSRTRGAMYALDTLLSQYGCDIYDDLSFGKGHRANMQDSKLDKDFIYYGCLDVIAPYHLHQMQLRKAKDQKHSSFFRFVTNQLSDTHKAFAWMEAKGLHVDKNKLLTLKSRSSPFVAVRNELERKFRKFKSVVAANKALLTKREIPSGFVDPWVFNIRNEESKQLLFFDVLGLKPLALTKKGLGKVDKAFRSKYKTVPEVEMFSRLQEFEKLKSTYIDDLCNRVLHEPDAKKDHCIRCTFDFASVTTGRTSSYDPNLQNLPHRTKEAKLIKEAFVANIGCISVDNDYKAHEVRMWGNLSRDQNLCQSFKAGMEMAVEYRLSGDQRLLTMLKTEGDIHRLNYQHFFGVKPADVTEVQRQSVKAVVFGVIYGKTAAGLAVSLNISEDEAQGLIDLMFTKFSNGHKWLTRKIQLARKHYFIETPVGMRRHLWGYLHNRQSFHNAMDRRSPNSEIQGIASQIGINSIVEVNKLGWYLFARQGLPYDPRVVANYVHDSVKSQPLIHMLPVHLYMIEHASTTRIHRLYEAINDMRFTVGLEVDFNLGPSAAHLTSWDSRPNSLEDLAAACIDWQNENLNARLNKTRIMRKFKHNNDIISTIRTKELQRQSRKPFNYVPTEMLLTPEKARAASFAF